MISIRSTASLLALALGAATVGFAGETDKRPVDRPVVTHVGSGMASEPGRIVIEGRQLGLIQEVRLDGAILPVLRNNGYELVLAPAARDPGFGKLELAYPRGVLTEVLEFTPTLAAHHLPRHINLFLNGGDAGGFYALTYSFRLRTSPLQHSGIYYLDWLDMSSPFSGLVAAGWMDGVATEHFTWERLGLINRPVFFQALCTADDGRMCYSNVVAVYHGHPAPGSAPMPTFR